MDMIHKLNKMNIRTPGHGGYASSIDKTIFIKTKTKKHTWNNFLSPPSYLFFSFSSLSNSFSIY